MTAAADIRAVDCWVNPMTPGQSGDAPEFLKTVARDYFKREAEIFRGTPLDQMVASMEAAGIERAVLTCDGNDPGPVAEMARQYPGRFLLSIVVDPMAGMTTIRTIERAVREFGVRLIRIVPFLFNRPPNDKVCYPLYSKCIELGVPISINTGIPGPPMPAEPQRPLHLDEICLFYPELKIIMAHGADPWWGEAIRLLLKYPNLYMMTSAYLPKYLPEELIRFMNTRGQTKVLFATDFPFLPFDRAIAEAKALPFRDGVLERYLRLNALEALDWS
ncbi:MAG: amidohydrolase family protein [Candidatus Binatia bacterium]